MSDLSAYKGKLAMVTGAGDGIGEMLARQLAAAGMKVCVQDIREDAAARVAADIGGALSRSLSTSRTATPAPQQPKNLPRTDRSICSG